MIDSIHVICYNIVIVTRRRSVCVIRKRNIIQYVDMEEKDLERVVFQGLKYETIEKEKAAERKALTRKHGLKPEDAKYSQNIQGQSRDIVAKKLGISGRHWERMKYIYQHREQFEDQEYQDWRTGKTSTSKLYNKLNNEKKSLKDFDRIIDKIDTMQMHTFRFFAFDGFRRLESKEEDLEDLLYRYKCPDSLKKEVRSTIKSAKNIANNFVGKQNDELLELKSEVEELKKKIERSLQNNQ